MLRLTLRQFLLVLTALHCVLWSAFAAIEFETVTTFRLGPRGASEKLPATGPDGAFYGTTRDGGSTFGGTVYRLAPDGTLSKIADAPAEDGALFHGTPAFAANGDLLVDAVLDFGYGSDAIYRINSLGAISLLVRMDFINLPKVPERISGPLSPGPGGLFFGTSEAGGDGFGTVFSLAENGLVNVLVNFTGRTGQRPGAAPVGGLLLALDGNFYGVTKHGGSHDLGTIFRVSPNGAFTSLVQFTGSVGGKRGARPAARLVEGNGGTLYGTTKAGGENGRGTIFQLGADGRFRSLAAFPSGARSPRGPIGALVFDAQSMALFGTMKSGGRDYFGAIFRFDLSAQAGGVTFPFHFNYYGTDDAGGLPTAGLGRADDGRIFGTTTTAGLGQNGTFFIFDPTSNEATQLTGFSGDDMPLRGYLPVLGLIEPDGTLYGTTTDGGRFSFGTVFRVRPGEERETLVEFSGSSGPLPGWYPSSLVKGGDGRIYGTTNYGGGLNSGTIFAFTPGSGEITDLQSLVSFTGSGGASPGTSPYGGLSVGPNGDLFGTTYYGGPDSRGSIFQLTTNGTFSNLANFYMSRKIGFRPFGPPVVLADGTLLGTTNYGGRFDRGTIYRLPVGGDLVRCTPSIPGRPCAKENIQGISLLIRGCLGHSSEPCPPAARLPATMPAERSFGWRPTASSRSPQTSIMTIRSHSASIPFARAASLHPTASSRDPTARCMGLLATAVPAAMEPCSGYQRMRTARASRRCSRLGPRLRKTRTPFNLKILPSVGMDTFI